MGHYYAEMCCKKCGRIPCTCPKDPPLSEQERHRRNMEFFKSPYYKMLVDLLEEKKNNDK